MAEKTEVKATGKFANYPYDTHTMMRPMGNDFNPKVEEIDRDLQAWLDSGFKLLSTHYAGDAGPAGARMIYVLVRS